MTLFDKKWSIFRKYLYIFSFSFLSFTFVCFLYNYRNLLDHGGQDYYIDGIKFQTFKKRYANLYKTDYFVFHEPYKGNIKVIKFMDNEYKVLKSSSKIGSKDSMDYLSGSTCRYYISSIDGYVKFFVEDSIKIRVKLYDYTPSYSADDPDRWKNSFDINGRTIPCDKNKEIISAFEKEVLSKIAPYEKDYIQGYIQQYVSFFERNFLYYLGFSIVLFIPLVVRFLINFIKLMKNLFFAKRRNKTTE